MHVYKSLEYFKNINNVSFMFWILNIFIYVGLLISGISQEPVEIRTVYRKSVLYNLHGFEVHLTSF